MLGLLESEAFEAPVRRLSFAHAIGKALNEMGMSGVAAEGFISVLLERGLSEDAELLVKEVFERNAVYEAPPGRFSSSGQPTFYSALEWETAVEEVRQTQIKRLRIALEGSEGYRPAYFFGLECDFSGAVFDLRGAADAFPFLRDPDPSSYGACQALADEARTRLVAALIAGSSQVAEGTCVPVFSRPALSAARRTGKYRASSNQAGDIAITKV